MIGSQPPAPTQNVEMQVATNKKSGSATRRGGGRPMVRDLSAQTGALTSSARMGVGSGDGVADGPTEGKPPLESGCITPLYHSRTGRTKPVVHGSQNAICKSQIRQTGAGLRTRAILYFHLCILNPDFPYLAMAALGARSPKAGHAKSYYPIKRPTAAISVSVFPTRACWTFASRNLASANGCRRSTLLLTSWLGRDALERCPRLLRSPGRDSPTHSG